MSDDKVEHVEAIDLTKRTSEHEGNGEALHDPGYCWYNDQRYSAGSYVCAGRQKMKCKDDGKWHAAGAC